MPASDSWSQWLWWVHHDYRDVFYSCLIAVDLIRKDKVDLQRTLRIFSSNLLRAQRLHTVFYPIQQSGIPMDASAILDNPLHGDLSPQQARLVMPAAPDLFLHWLAMSAPEYGGDVDICISTVDAIAHNTIEQETGLQLLEQQFRRLRNLYSGIWSLVPRREGPCSVKEALFIAMELVQCPVIIDMSGDCETQYADSMMPIILAMLLWTQRNQREDGPFVEVSCTSGGSRIFIAPHRAELGSDWPDVTPTINQRGDSEPGGGWFRTVASELANSGHSFTVRSKGPLSTFLIVYPRQKPDDRPHAAG
jgi:hypothetical protein